jgi:hypothetical protein
LDGFDHASLAWPMQRTPKFADRLIDRPIEFDEGAIGPQTTTKFLARDDPSAAVEECEQNPHRLFA